MDAYASACRIGKKAGGGGNHGSPTISRAIFLESGPDNVAARKSKGKGVNTENCAHRHTASKELTSKDPRKDTTGFVASHCAHQSIINVIGTRPILLLNDT